MLALEPVLSQDAPPESTSNTDFDKKTRSSHKKSKSKNVLYLIKKDTQNTSYGNPCVVEITRSKGFEYLVTLKANLGIRVRCNEGFITLE